MDFLEEIDENVYVELTALTVKKKVKKSLISKFRRIDIDEMIWDLEEEK